MKLIKRKTLIYQQGSSDKIHKIDLCQISDRYVVNFRYGKRGNTLREVQKLSSQLRKLKLKKSLIS